ncbi:MAG: type II secretion system protein [Porticoccaceae bacterium]|nr:type II secretion system protein [Porticoccaceae bacterium]
MPLMIARQYQRGFTLIEMLVAVMIVAALSAMSILAINQAFDRRYVAEADRLLIWLQQLGENSALQGAAYGVVGEAGDAGTQLRAVIYYRNRWVAVTMPAPFTLSDDATLNWLVDSVDDEQLLPQQTDIGPMDIAAEDENEDDLLIPEIAFLPDGYIEPSGEIVLSFAAMEKKFIYRWTDESQMTVPLSLESSRP